MQCEHILKYVHQKICPYCGKDTHEPNIELEHMLFVEYYESEEPKKWVCPKDGGTIRGWWSI